MSALNKTKSWRNISDESRRDFLKILLGWALAMSSETSKAVQSILDFEPNIEFEFPEAETLS